ncbi:hypothetical protein JMJ77_0013135 [Colletotrichum scovillei]|uniref:Uncharacterized protein n=1 Tax=Colletotrichum scovillei TaxID=1209932 RepID=A0A9P7R8D7_9PEZI|nr:hypothetical protein JMJ77_0013135 [Colletotrichum scovillei]KAG7069425.1 hypothetical protein JMJ76_0003097 [Colletotrichum scovillei]KAG7073341.1 hypothetical protein JMJ78_0014320 [Colletotrichum scovillei]
MHPHPQDRIVFCLQETAGVRPLQWHLLHP